MNTQDTHVAQGAQDTRDVQGAQATLNTPDIPDTQAAQEKQRNPILRIFDFAGSYKKLTLLGCFLAALNGIVTIAPLICVWFVVHSFVLAAPHWQDALEAVSYGWWAVAFAVGSVLIYFAALMCTHLAAFRTAANMRNAALDHLSKVPLGYFSTHSSGALRRVIDGCAGQTESVLAHKLPDFCGALVTPVAFLVVMFIFDWVMGLACLIPIIVSAALMMYMMGSGSGEKSYMSFMIRYQDALDKMNKAAVEYVRGIPVVKVFQQTVHSFKAFKEAIYEYSDMAHGYSKKCEKPQVAQLVAINSTFALLIPAGILIAGSTGDFSLFLTNFLFYVLFSSITTTMMNKVMYSSEAITMAQDSVRRIESILAVPLMEEVSAAKARVPKDDSIEFKHVSFSYPGTERKAVDDVSFTASTGSVIALVGPSGGGKTTAASLVPRFWDACEGQVLVGGVDVRHIKSESLMSHIAFVFQNEHLFKQSLFDNIRAARPNATQNEVLAAASAAQCDDIIAKLPQGINTVVGTEGVFLSGGECQRIALARAILKDAPIVVLDEATAFADPENEALIQQALKTLCKGKTVLMIAHRLSTVAHADAICVLEEGRLVEQGTHDELIAAGSVYARMWNDYQTSVAWKIGRIEQEERKAHVA